MAELIYLVEDDESIRELVLYALKQSGFEARGFISGREFWPAVGENPPALLILDIMLPGDDGLTILKKLRENPGGESLPVILLTAKSSEYDRVRGLDLGADDYVCKPFGVMELISRVRAVLRRARPESREGILTQGEVELDEKRRAVTAAGRPVSLTFKEFELLRYLMKNKGLVLSRDQIMEAVWGFDYQGESRTVDMHVKSLRQKLGECGGIIGTVRGVGYQIGA